MTVEGLEELDIEIPPPPEPVGVLDGRRLVIVKMELHNFKSYGQTQYLGPFHKCFTSIVGPNGSGKSNVIDAMLFVFGYRTSKLRFSKLSSLIHNSDTYPDCTSCSVRIHFAQIYDKLENEMDIIEDSEFTISRTAKKDGSSYYCINDQQKPFKVVHKHLLDLGIDLKHNRFLILQGEVEQISLMKPKAEVEGESGMLEYLEDIIGTTRLKEPLEKLNTKVAELNELRAEKINRCKIVQKEKEALEPYKEEAIEYHRMQNTILRDRIRVFGKKKIRFMEKFEKSKAEFEAAENKYNDDMKGHTEILEKQQQEQSRTDELVTELNDVSSKLEKIKETKKSLEKEGEKNRITNTTTFERGKKIIEDKALTDGILKEANTELPKLEEQVEDYEKQKIVLSESKPAIENELAEMRKTLEDELKPLRLKRGEHESILVSMQKEINDAKAALDLKRSDLDNYGLQERKEKSRLKDLEQEYESNLNKYEGKKKYFEEGTRDMPDNLRQIESNKVKLTELTNKRNDEKTKLNQKKQTLSDAISIIRDKESRNRVLTKIMEQKRSGAIEGIYGRLGDLATIDKKYDIAISTIVGGHLDKILTDCPKTSSKCIEYLKKNSIGVATFSALDQKRKYNHANFDFNEPAERLIDLIQVQDERFIPAFSDILRDTLVVANSDIANRIAFTGRGWTVVTLQGHIYRSTGVMTGGGRPVSGKMRLSSENKRSSLAAGMTEEDITRLEQETKALEAIIEQIDIEINRLEAQTKRLKEDYETKQISLPNLEKELEDLRKNVDCYKQEIEVCKQKIEEVKPDPKKVAEFEVEIEELQKVYDSAKDKARLVESEIKEIDDQIKSTISGKLGSYERKLNKLTKDLDEINFNLARAQAAIKNNERTREKCKEKIAQYKKEVQESNELLEELKSKRKEIRHQLDELGKESEAILERQENIAVELKEHQAKLTQLKEEETKFQAANLDMKHKVDLLKKRMEDDERHVSRCDQEVSSIKLNEIDGIDLNKTDAEEEAAKDEKSIEQLEKEIEQMERDINKMKPNLGAIEEFRQKQTLYIERTKELDVVTQRRDNLRDAYERVKTMRTEEFKSGFLVINRKLKEMYRMITLGGDAELEYSDSLDPFLEGIIFSVRPNKKTWKRISNLSGGEKTLSSLSLIFALHHYKPSPLYVMDEIDAALDFKNVSIVGNYIKDRTKNTQFLIISLRNNMYELSDRLVGIYKTYNSTKALAYTLA